MVDRLYIYEQAVIDLWFVLLLAGFIWNIRIRVCFVRYSLVFRGKRRKNEINQLYIVNVCAGLQGRADRVKRLMGGSSGSCGLLL